MKEGRPGAPSSPDDQKLHFAEIEAMRSPLEKILSELSADIESGKFVLVIGDDASGRLPTLALKKVIDSRYQHLGRQPITTRFIAPPRYGMASYERELRANFDQKIDSIVTSEAAVKSKEGAKILVVTDFISTGNTLYPLIERLKLLGVDFVVAAMRAGADTPLGIREGIDVVGETSYHVPGIYNRSRMSGVKKKKRDELDPIITTAFRNKFETGDPVIKEISDSVTHARKDIDTLSSELLDKYIKNLKENS